MVSLLLPGRMAEPNNAPDFPVKRADWIFAKLLSRVSSSRLLRPGALVSSLGSRTRVASSQIRAETSRSLVEPRCPGPWERKRKIVLLAQDTSLLHNIT